MEDANDCKTCIAEISKVAVGIGKIETGIQVLNQNFMKIFFSLIGVITAVFGSNFIGTPWHIELIMWAYMFGATFVFLIVIAKWRCLNFWEKWIRISFITLAFWATGLRIYHYQTSTPFTQTEGMITQLISLSMAIGFIILAWKRDSLIKLKRRRYTDYADSKLDADSNR